MRKFKKLYTIHSCVDEFPFFEDVFDGVFFHWHAQGRKEPVADYRELVIGYEELDDYQKERAREWVDEGFTESEVAIIKPMIERFSNGLMLTQKAIPVIIEGECFPYWFYADLSISAIREGFVELDQDSLPFEVVGYYGIMDGIKRQEKKLSAINKLYTASSNFDELRDRKNVIVDWYKGIPNLENGDYSELIKHYDLLDELEKREAEEYVKELFTEDEIAPLSEFLEKQFGNAPVVVEKSIPVEFKDFENGTKPTVLARGSSQENTLWPRSLDCFGYQLPFEVKGYYDLKLHSSAKELSE